MEHTLGVELDTVGDDRLLGLAIGQGARVFVDLNCRLSRASVRTDPIDDSACAA